MLSRFRGCKTQPKRPSCELLTLQARHVDRIRSLWKLSRFLQTLRCHLDFELPKIVLLGGAPANQISLLECLTGVKLPPELEKEQRAPVEFRLSRIADCEWTCLIKIRREFKTQNIKNHAEDVEETNFGEILKDPGEVEGLLREVHKYLLDQQYLASQNNIPECAPNSCERRRQKNKTFSKNVICVEIQGNSVADLTLVTLPNFTAIHSSQALQDFTLGYLTANCWILLLTQRLDRLQIHPAFYLAQQVDPLGDRTLGISCCASVGDGAPMNARKDRSATIRSRLETLHTRSVGEKLSNSTSRLSRPTLRWKSVRSSRAELSRWRVGRLYGQSLSETRLDMTFDDFDLKVLLENISCELFEKSMPQVLELITQKCLVHKSIPIPSDTDDIASNDVFRYTYAACASDITYLMTSAISGNKYNRELESIYKLLGRRAFAVLPLFVPLASREDDSEAFRQITEFADMNLYADAYKSKEFGNTRIMSRRPRVYLREVRYHLKSINPETPEISFIPGQKTPLMDLPIRKWKSYAFDAMSSVICLFQEAIEDIIIKRCVEASSCQPYIMKIIFLKINQIFDGAKKNLSEALEFELVPYVESFQYFATLRDSLLDDYRLSCHLLNQKTGKTRTLTKSFPKPQTKMNHWNLEINACADAGAYLNLALTNFLDKTSMIIEKDLLEQIEVSDLFQLPVLPPPKTKELVVHDELDAEFPIYKSPRGGDATSQSLEVAVQLAKIIETTMQNTADELHLIDPFMKS